MIKFTKSLRQALINEVENVPSEWLRVKEDGSPKVKIKTKVVKPWMWVASTANHSGVEWDPSTDRVLGDPFSKSAFHHWVGEAKSAPKVASHLEDLNDWALLYTLEWSRERVVDKITKKGIMMRAPHGVEEAHRLIDLRPFLDSSFDELVGFLENENPFIREIVAKLLGSFDDLRAINPLIQAIDDESYFVQEMAIRALGKLSGGAAIQKLAAMLRDTDYPRTSVSCALVEIGESALDSILPVIHGENERASLAAVEIIEAIGGPRSFEILVQAIGEERLAVRKRIIEALGKLGNRKAIDTLIDQLQDENPEIQKIAARTLGNLDDKRAIAPLVSTLLSNDRYVRKEAADTLFQLDWQPGNPDEIAWELFAREEWKKLIALKESALDTIIRALNDDDLSDTYGILKVFSTEHSINDQRLIEPLLKIYAAEVSSYGKKYHAGYYLVEDHPEKHIRAYAIHALGRVENSQVIKPLIQIYLQDDSNYLRNKAFRSIARLVIAGVDVAEILIPLLKEKPPSRFKENDIKGYLKLFTVVPASLEQIKEITSLLKSAVKRDVNKSTTKIASGMLQLDKLFSNLSDGNKTTRKKAVGSLHKIGLPSTAIPLVSALEDDYHMVRKKAVAALGKLGGKNPSSGIADGKKIRALSPDLAVMICKALVRSLEDDDISVRNEVVIALAIVGSRALSIVLAAISSKIPRVRFGATIALGYIRDVTAAKPLMKTLRDKHRMVRQNAAWALGHLRLKRDEHRALRGKIINALTKAMNTDECFPVRFNAVYSLAIIYDSRVVEPLLKAMDSSVEECRLNATYGFLNTLGYMEVSSSIQSQVVDRLIIALSDDVDRVRYNAADGLRKVGGEKALKALISVKDDEDAKMRELVERGIKEIEDLIDGRQFSSSYTIRNHYELQI